MDRSRASPGDTECQRCGACCASFRVSFYWAEAETLALPAAMLEQVSPWHACLAGTNAARPRCAALAGAIGNSVSCLIYASRPSPCREVQMGDAQCRKARFRHALGELPGALAAVDARTDPAG